MTQKRWAAFKNERKFVLPTAGIEVIIKEPDIVSSMILDGHLPDAFFAMFANATQEGEEDGLSFIQKLNNDKEASEGLRQFIDMLVLEAFVEPRLVENAEEADYQTTILISDVKFMDKFAVVQELDIMGGIAQLNGLQQFRTEANGTLASSPEIAELQPVAEPNSSN